MPSRPPAYAPSVRARTLARELRRLREAANLTATEAAAQLGMSQPKISHIENLRSKPNIADVTAMLDLYGVTSPERDALLTLAREAARRGWWTDYADVFTGSYIALEDAAKTIRTWQTQVLPGLLQTDDYAREVIRAGRDTSAEDLQRRVMARMARKSLLKREIPRAPDLHAIIEEPVLRKRIGGIDVMREQLRALRVAAELPNVTIQVLPRDTESAAGLEGPFVIFSFEETIHPDIAYVEGIFGDVYLEGSEQVTRCSVMFERIRDAALDPDESAALIAAVAKE